jgi:putative transposase
LSPPPPASSRQSAALPTAMTMPSPTIGGLFKTEIIRMVGPWRSLEAAEFATLERVDRFNNRRLLESIGHIPPAEDEANFFLQLKEPNLAA